MDLEEVDYAHYFQTYWTVEIDTVPNATKFSTYFYKSSKQHNAEILNAEPIEVWHAVSLWHYDNTDETSLSFRTCTPYLVVKELVEAKNIRPATPVEINELNEKWEEHKKETAKLMERIEVKRNAEREI